MAESKKSSKEVISRKSISSIEAEFKEFSHAIEVDIEYLSADVEGTKRQGDVEQVRKTAQGLGNVEENEDEESQKERGEDVLRGDGEDDDVHAMSLLESAELRQAEWKALMAQQFEILTGLRSEHHSLRKRTLFITSRLMQYLRKQKMDHLFMTVKEDPESEQQLLQKLIEFHDCNQRIGKEKARIQTEWEIQRSINEMLRTEMTKKLEELMGHMKEVAGKLVDPRTGRTVQHYKMFEEFSSRQEQQIKQLSESRLIQIKLGRRINFKRAERQIDNMGIDFRLMEYEKLTSQKEYFTEKITERDIENRELKEKKALMEDNLEKICRQLKQREDELEPERLKLHFLTNNLNEKRGNLNHIKITKCKIDKNTARVKHESGLLAYPTLMKDYKEQMQQVEELRSQTDHLKQQYKNVLNRVHKLNEAVTRKTEAQRSS